MLPKLDPKLLIQGCLLVLSFFFLLFFYLVIDFKGITEAEGMEQADLARSLAVGEGFSTNIHFPKTMKLAVEKRGVEILRPEKSIHTSHAPLLPFFNSLFFRITDAEQTLPDDETIFELDRVIVAQSLIFFVLAIATAFLLISRLFDARIALVSVILMILCETMWLFTRSGLAQMHLLFFFNLALVFLHEAYLRASAGNEKSPLVPSILAGCMFALLCFTHWLAFWPFLGIFVVVATSFPANRVVALGVSSPVIVSFGAWGLRNIAVYGDPLGIAKQGPLAALSQGSSNPLLRDYSPDLNFLLKGLPSKLAYGTVSQLETLYVFLGSVVVAPLFFIAVLHNYRNPAVRTFRWIILSAWVFSAFGMVLFGIDGEKKVAFNQMHILFMPIMSAFGLALLSILWGRLQIRSGHIYVLRGPLIAAIVISALPLVFSLPQKISRGLQGKTKSVTLANWPPYYPPVFSQLGERMEKGQYLVTDNPAGLAWYGNCPSILLPRNRAQLAEISSDLEQVEHSIMGVLLTPNTTFLGLSNTILQGAEKPWAPLIMQGPIQQLFPQANGYRSIPNFPYPFYQRIFTNSEIVFFGKKRF